MLFNIDISGQCYKQFTAVALILLIEASEYVFAVAVTYSCKLFMSLDRRHLYKTFLSIHKTYFGMFLRK
jgi:hypothetical protein